MTDPDVLRELQRLADHLALMPHVSAVNHIGKVLELGNESMSGERRLPDTNAPVAMLYRVLAGNPAIRQLVTDEHKHALVNVRIDTDRYEPVTALVAEAERWITEHGIVDYRIVRRDGTPAPELDGWLRELVLYRVMAGLRTAKVAVDDAVRGRLEAKLAEPGPQGDRGEVERQITKFLRSDESILEDEQRAHAEAIAAGAVALGPEPKEEELRRAIAEALPDDSSESLLDDVALSVSTPLREAWRKERSLAWASTMLRDAGVDLSSSLHRERTLAVVANALLDLERPSGLAKAGAATPAGALQTTVSGQPVLYRGLSQSVTSNQFWSLASSLGLVLVILCVLFRSIATGLLASAPMVATLAIVFGVMGARGIHLDIGTSMLSSIIVGAGVDFAVHMLAAWRADRGQSLEDAAARAAQHTGPAIWTNAIMVAAGFFVLTLGQARPLQMIGGLTATAMIVAALATFLTLPLLARRSSYHAWGSEPHVEPAPRPKVAARAPS
jgi:predicted RND superfamily exporter protein